MMNISKLFSATILISLSFACSEEPLSTGKAFGDTKLTGDGTWLIPKNEVRDGGPGKDGIPALLEPEFLATEAIHYLSDDDLVIAFKWGDTVRAYPHAILDQHEIVNDRIDTLAFAISYCPLTGTGMAWNRKIGDFTTSFGVSGLLYNSNLIPYDRATNSNWSQMRLDCVNGELQKTQAEMLPVLETTYGTLKKWYPDINVIGANTGYNRSYGYFPYGNYKTDDNYLLFPVSRTDDRVPNKERVYGVLTENDLLVFRFGEQTSESELIQFRLSGQDFVLVRNKNAKYMVAFLSTTTNGEEKEFSLLHNEYPLILLDKEGTKWDVFGVAQEGPGRGQRLKAANSYMGYWFAWAAFFDMPTIYF